MNNEQLTFDFSGLARALEARGIGGLRARLLRVAALKGVQCRLDEQRVSALSLSQRQLAAELNASKSGVQEALSVLALQGIVASAPGRLLVYWDRLDELPEIDWVTDLAARSAGGRSVVGPCIQEQETKFQPSIQTNTSSNSSSALEAPRARAGWLGYRLGMADLVADGRLNAPGIRRLHAQAVANNWIDCDLGGFLPLVLYVLDREATAAQQIEHPLRWLLWALRAGPHQWQHRPHPRHRDRAAALLNPTRVPSAATAD